MFLAIFAFLDRAKDYEESVKLIKFRRLYSVQVVMIRERCWRVRKGFKNESFWWKERVKDEVEECLCAGRTI